uniref:Uncharacterized protein n=1 Tax=Medicago truncatula TaxID=3880 RepID=I3SRK5_MEDTR|nr:unknown [Medicago truncatula]
MKSSFRSTVSTIPRSRYQPSNTSNVNNLSPFPSCHVGNYSLDHSHGTKDVSFKRVLNRRERNFSKWAHTRNTSVINKNIDTTKFIQNIIHNSVHAFIRLNIEFLKEEFRVLIQIRHG